MDAITPEFVRHLRKQLKAHQAEAQSHLEKAKAIEMMLEGAKRFDPDSYTAVANEESGTGAAPSGSVREAIRAVLEGSDRPMTKLGLRERLIESGFPADRLGNNFSYFYTTLRRMERAGQVSRRGKMFSKPT